VRNESSFSTQYLGLKLKRPARLVPPRRSSESIDNGSPMEDSGRFGDSASLSLFESSLPGIADLGR